MIALLRAVFRYFLFTSLFITGCALLMVQQTKDLLLLQYDHEGYLLFVFFATICSYNFHWYLTPDTPSENERVHWTQQHKRLHLVLTLMGFAGACVLFFRFSHHWIWLGGAVVLTFLYSAPKLHVGPFRLLRKIAIGKTLFLTFVWTYVTTILPLAFDGRWTTPGILFCLSRFFLIYAICILFDYRDREYDKQEGMRSLITYLDEKGINVLFAITILLFTASTAALYYWGFSLLNVCLLFIPSVILVRLYPVAKTNFSDYLYYFVLDGLMMLSAMLTTLAGWLM